MGNKICFSFLACMKDIGLFVEENTGDVIKDDPYVSLKSVKTLVVARWSLFYRILRVLFI